MSKNRKYIEPEIININGINYKHFYSKNNFMILKEGTEEIYSDAIDSMDSTYKYIETDIPIETPEESDK